MQNNNSYEQAGFDRFFRRGLNIPQGTSPQMTSYQLDSEIQSMSANKIQGGKMVSQNGNLTIDLENGVLSYNDGVQTLLNVGGVDNDLTIVDANGDTILNT